ncbi:hypothetical protein, partial [Nocardia mangyaensis]|uniref:hypothetical protein n=1 Tax=Nocardia mangyaensis TaxID=2213200 RepID=UPI0026764CEA
QKYKDLQQQQDPTQAEVMIQQAAEKPEEFSQEQLDYFSNVREGQYEAPEQLNLGEEQNKLKALETLGQQIGTSKGRVGVLKENLQRPGYTQGQTSLDEYLFGRDPSVRSSNINAIRGKVVDVKKRIEGVQGELKPLSEETQGKISKASESIRNKLKEMRGTFNSETGQYEGGIRGDIQSAQQQEATIQEDIRKFIAGEQSTLSPEAAARLGAKEGEYIYGISPQDLGSSEIGGMISPEQAAKLKALGQLAGQPDKLAQLAQDYEYMSPEQRQAELSGRYTKALESFQSEISNTNEGISATSDLRNDIVFLCRSRGIPSSTMERVYNYTPLRSMVGSAAYGANSSRVLNALINEGIPRDSVLNMTSAQATNILNQRKQMKQQKYLQSGQQVSIAQTQ